MPPPARASRLEDDALVLRRFPYGDSSLVLRLLSRRHGRIQALAKGAYRPKSRYSGVFDLFDTLRVRVSGRGEGGLWLVTEASIGARRRAVAQDLARYRAGLAVLELGDLGAREGEADARLFALLETALDALAAGAAEPRLVRVAFDLAFLGCMGLAPALEACASCGSRPRDGGGASAPFSVAAGGRLCADCAAEARRNGERVDALPLNTLRVARSLGEARMQGLARVRVEPGLLRGVDACVQRFLEYHLETRPRCRPAPGAEPSPRPRPARPLTRR